MQTINTNLYICHTAYHLLIALIKAMNNEDRNELILCQACNLDEKMIKRVKDSRVFHEVLVYKNMDDYSPELDLRTNIFTRSKILKQRVKKRFDINYLKNKELFIFNDITFFGKTFNIFRMKYNLIEDGLDCFKNTVFLNYVDKKNSFREAIKLVLGISIRNYGRSFYTKTIEVNDGNGIYLKKTKKIRVVPRKEMFEQMTDMQKKQIVNIFLDKNEVEYLHSLRLEDASLLITQPLSEDGIVEEDRKIKIYEYLIRHYGTSRIYIKTHPREKTDYYGIFPGCEILQLKKCPLEVFAFVEGFHFKKVITAFSTAIHSIEFCDEKVLMGQEWVKQFCENYCNDRVTEKL